MVTKLISKNVNDGDDHSDNKIITASGAHCIFQRWVKHYFLSCRGFWPLHSLHWKWGLCPLSSIREAFNWFVTNRLWQKWQCIISDIKWEKEILCVPINYNTHSWIPKMPCKRFSSPENGHHAVREPHHTRG